MNSASLNSLAGRYDNPLPPRFLAPKDSLKIPALLVFLLLTPSAYQAPTHRARIFKRLWSPGIDSKEWIPPAYVAWRAGTITLFLLGA